MFGDVFVCFGTLTFYDPLSKHEIRMGNFSGFKMHHFLATLKKKKNWANIL
jgi:hypothetical protein